MMALEPEAAAMYVKNLPLTKKKEGILGDSFTTFGTGHKYLVLDTGGKNYRKKTFKFCIHQEHVQ